MSETKYDILRIKTVKSKLGLTSLQLRRYKTKSGVYRYWIIDRCEELITKDGTSITSKGHLSVFAANRYFDTMFNILFGGKDYRVVGEITTSQLID